MWHREKEAKKGEQSVSQKITEINKLKIGMRFSDSVNRLDY